MAIDINITIPDDRVDEVLEAFGHGYAPGGVRMNEAQFLDCLKTWINNTVIGHQFTQQQDKLRKDIEAAQNAATPRTPPVV